MKKTRGFKKTILALTVALVACAGPVLYPLIPSANNVQSQVDRVKKLAGTDLQQLVRLCNPQSAERAQPSDRMDESIRQLIARPAPPPCRCSTTCTTLGVTG